MYTYVQLVSLLLIQIIVTYNKTIIGHNGGECNGGEFVMILPSQGRAIS